MLSTAMPKTPDRVRETAGVFGSWAAARSTACRLISASRNATVGRTPGAGFGRRIRRSSSPIDITESGPVHRAGSEPAKRRAQLFPQPSFRPRRPSRQPHQHASIARYAVDGAGKRLGRNLHSGGQTLDEKTGPVAGGVFRAEGDPDGRRRVAGTGRGEQNERRTSERQGRGTGAI